jgi:DNA-binding response OmpR family regulator
MPDTATILVVDDEDDIRRAIGTVLKRSGYEIVEASDGARCVDVIRERDIDLVVLDVAMPRVDGFRALERIRDFSDVLVLMLTARAEQHDKLRGLGTGADDYLTKPFDNAELVARVRALLRRKTDAQADNVYDDGLLRVDFAARTVHVHGAEKALTPVEWNVLTALVRQPGETLTKERLLELAWHDPLAIGPERVKFTVLRLRRRLDLADPASSPIEAVRGVGYRYRRQRDGGTT